MKDISKELKFKYHTTVNTTIDFEKMQPKMKEANQPSYPKVYHQTSLSKPTIFYEVKTEAKVN